MTKQSNQFPHRQLSDRAVFALSHGVPPHAVDGGKFDAEEVITELARRLVWSGMKPDGGNLAECESAVDIATRLLMEEAPIKCAVGVAHFGGWIFSSNGQADAAGRTTRASANEFELMAINEIAEIIRGAASNGAAAENIFAAIRAGEVKIFPQQPHDLSFVANRIAEAAQSGQIVSPSVKKSLMSLVKDIRDGMVSFNPPVSMAYHNSVIADLEETRSRLARLTEEHAELRGAHAAAVERGDGAEKNYHESQELNIERKAQNDELRKLCETQENTLQSVKGELAERRAEGQNYHDAIVDTIAQLRTLRANCTSGIHPYQFDALIATLAHAGVKTA